MVLSGQVDRRFGAVCTVVLAVSCFGIKGLAPLWLEAKCARGQSSRICNRNHICVVDLLRLGLGITFYLIVVVFFKEGRDVVPIC